MGHFQRLFWGFGLFSTAISQPNNGAVDAVRRRNFTYETVTSDSGKDSSMTFPISLASSETLPSTTSTSNFFLSTPSSISTTSIIIPGSSPTTDPSRDRACRSCEYTFAVDSTALSSDDNPSSSAAFTQKNTNLTASSANPSRSYVASSTITTKPDDPTPSSVCEQGRKGCDSNTNTSKTRLPSDDQSYSNKATSFYYPNSTKASPTDKTTACDVTLEPGDPGTVWVILPNTETTTLTVTGNFSTSFTTTSEFTPPVYCYPLTQNPEGIPFSYPFGEEPGTSDAGAKTSSAYGYAPHVSYAPTTVIVTSKNPVTVFSTETPPSYPGVPKTDKVSVTPSSARVEGIPTLPSSPKTVPSGTTIPLDQFITAGTPTIPTVIGGVPVIVQPTQIVIGSQTIGNIGNGAPITKITQDGATFTVNPSQVIGPGVTIPIPTLNGGVFVPTPTSTVIAGVPILLGPSLAIIDGSTYAIGNGASEQTIFAHGQTISIGSEGLGFAQTTVVPPSLPTNIVILDSDTFSVIGGSEAVIGGTTFFYGPSISPQTDIFSGATITIGPSGVSFGTTVLGGSGSTGLELGIAGGVSVTEIGSSIAVIDGTTFVVGPGAQPTTAVVAGKTVTAGPDGLGVGEATLPYPFNPATQVITAGGISFSEIGSTLVDIGGTTFTIGLGAQQTTDIYNGQTISIGPGGIGFKTTTITATSGPSPTTSVKATSKNSGTSDLRPYFGVMVVCIALGVWFNI